MFKGPAKQRPFSFTMKAKRILWLLAAVCIIDAMGFGMMIPLIYVYGKQFGLTKVTLGCLTAVFSVAQFFATPVLGTLSDRYGRKVLLVTCLFGTAASFALFGLAGSLVMLFAARILDGLTGGDISVAQAMVTDISKPANRAKYFGILGSAFGFGYVIGPALGGLLSRFGMRVPFFVAAGLSLTGAIVALVLLEETGGKKKRPPFTYRALIRVLKRPVAGTAVLTGFLLTTAQFVMLIGFQTFCTDRLKMTPTQVGLFYAGFGISGILMQLAIPLVNKVVSARPVVLLASTMLCLAAIIFTGIVNTLWAFALGIVLYGLFNGLRNPMLNAIIADDSDDKEQGEIMGINQSYTSMGQALGPAIAGLAASLSLHLPFFLAGALMLLALRLAFRLKRRKNNCV